MLLERWLPAFSSPSTGDAIVGMRRATVRGPHLHARAIVAIDDAFDQGRSAGETRKKPPGNYPLSRRPKINFKNGMCPASYHNTAQLPPSDSRMFS